MGLNNMRNKFPVGINVFIIREGKLLLGKRKNVYGAGTWGLPGGHLEFGENMAKAAARELEEETGLKAEKFSFVNTVNDLRNDQHYLQIGFLAEGVENIEPILKEPDKAEKWEWFDLDNLPKEIFPSHIKQIQTFREKSFFSE